MVIGAPARPVADRRSHLRVEETASGRRAKNLQHLAALLAPDHFKSSTLRSRHICAPGCCRGRATTGQRALALNYSAAFGPWHAPPRLRCWLTDTSMEMRNIGCGMAAAAPASPLFGPARIAFKRGLPRAVRAAAAEPLGNVVPAPHHRDSQLAGGVSTRCERCPTYETNSWLQGLQTRPANPPPRTALHPAIPLVYPLQSPEPSAGGPPAPGG
jgi:hypothetical protein